MKKITIGRGRDCDIRLDDSSDNVSRRHAIITVTPFGKMKLFDTSSNGTFVNGVKVEKNTGVRIRRGDNINFAHITDLDWNLVKDPYKSIKITSLIVLFVAIVIAAILIIMANRISNKEMSPEMNVSGLVEDSLTTSKKDTLILNVPKDASGVASQKTKSIKDRKGKSEVIQKTKKTKKGQKSTTVEDLITPKNSNPTPENNSQIDEAINNQR